MEKQNSTLHSVPSSSLLKPALIGAVVGLIAISFFLIGAQAEPSWAKYWMIRPLIVVPMAGACGAVLLSLLRRTTQGSTKVIATILGFIGFIIALWIGIVLGLDGTMWN